jgi:hypothetical protein
MMIGDITEDQRPFHDYGKYSCSALRYQGSCVVNNDNVYCMQSKR